jgi:hypothetical protein
MLVKIHCKDRVGKLCKILIIFWWMTSFFLRGLIVDKIVHLNRHNKRCTPLEVIFSMPDENREVGHCGIEEQYMFFIYPVKAEFIQSDHSDLDSSTIGEITATQLGLL